MNHFIRVPSRDLSQRSAETEWLDGADAEDLRLRTVGRFLDHAPEQLHNVVPLATRR